MITEERIASILRHAAKEHLREMQANARGPLPIGRATGAGVQSGTAITLSMRALGPILEKGATQVAQEPSRLSEAVENIDTLIDVAQNFSSPSGEISPRSIRSALASICPLFPFC